MTFSPGVVTGVGLVRVDHGEWNAPVLRLVKPALLFLALAGPAAAATVRVEVVDENGSPVERPLVRMQRLDGEAGVGRYYKGYRTVPASAAGRAEFTDVEPGQYVVKAGAIEGTYIDPDLNPLAQPR